MWTLTAWNLTDSNKNHIVQVCQDDIFQAEAITRYIQEGLLKNEAVVIYAKPSLRKTVIGKLEQLGFEVSEYKRRGQLKFFDVELTLLCFYSEDTLHEANFQDFVGASLRDLRLKFGKVRIFSEMLNLLWRDSKYEAAMELEECWQNLARQLEFSLLLSYSLNKTDPDTLEEAVKLICEYHQHLQKVKPHHPSMIDKDTVLHLFVSTWDRINSSIAVTNPLSNPLSKNIIFQNKFIDN